MILYRFSTYASVISYIAPSRKEPSGQNTAYDIAYAIENRVRLNITLPILHVIDEDFLSILKESVHEKILSHKFIPYL